VKIEDILNQVGPLNKFKSTYRAVGIEEIERAAALINEAEERVRVYSNAGFVPNAYRYRCDIEYVEALRGTDGWTFRIGSTSAKRSGGSAAREVVR
jgi:hypothetical protein